MNEINKANVQGFWKEHFETWKGSGLTQKGYCMREGISYPRFVYQLNRVHKLKKTPIKFIEATIKSGEEDRSSSGLQVLLPNGVRIGFGGEVTAVLLQTVFSIAGSITC